MASTLERPTLERPSMIPVESDTPDQDAPPAEAVPPTPSRSLMSDRIALLVWIGGALIMTWILGKDLILALWGW